jgi:hypothetical protein
MSQRFLQFCFTCTVDFPKYYDCYNELLYDYKLPLNVVLNFLLGISFILFHIFGRHVLYTINVNYGVLSVSDLGSTMVVTSREGCVLLHGT